MTGEKVWEPIIAVMVLRKKDARSVKRSWGSFSLDYIPWASLKVSEKWTAAFVVCMMAIAVVLISVV